MNKIQKMLLRKKARIESRTVIELLLWIIFLALISWGIIYLLKKFA